jgi:hypothetical protein
MLSEQMAKAEGLRAGLEEQLAAIETLTPAMLERTFSGGL